MSLGNLLDGLGLFQGIAALFVVTYVALGKLRWPRYADGDFYLAWLAPIPIVCLLARSLGMVVPANTSFLKCLALSSFVSVPLALAVVWSFARVPERGLPKWVEKTASPPNKLIIATSGVLVCLLMVILMSYGAYGTQMMLRPCVRDECVLQIFLGSRRSNYGVLSLLAFVTAAGVLVSGTCMTLYYRITRGDLRTSVKFQSGNKFNN